MKLNLFESWPLTLAVALKCIQNIAMASTMAILIALIDSLQLVKVLSLQIKWKGSYSAKKD